VDHLDDLPTAEGGEVCDQRRLLAALGRRAHDHHDLVARADDIDKLAEAPMLVRAAHECQSLAAIVACTGGGSIASVPLDIAIEQFADGTEVADRRGFKTPARQFDVCLVHDAKFRTAKTSPVVGPTLIASPCMLGLRGLDLLQPYRLRAEVPDPEDHVSGYKSQYDEDDS
jgi:hypothetical protein